MAGRASFFALISSTLLLAAGCGGEQTVPGGSGGEPPGGGPAAVAQLRGAPGTNVSGTVSFFPAEGDQVRVVVEVRGVSPGAHGIHIHENGECVAPDFKSAGDHFNPTGAPHGCPPGESRHVGDFNNVRVREDGTGTLEITTPLVSLAGPSSVVGKAVILHQGADDCTSQPSGQSGDRIACGVIQPR